MINKILLLTFVLFSFSYAQLQEVRIGDIDKIYNNQINKVELRKILNEIESLFETKLGFDVFNYSSTGKPIDIVYLPLQLAEKRIVSKTKRLKRYEKDIENIKKSLPSEKSQIEDYQKNLQKFASHIVERTDLVNTYVTNINKQKSYTKEQYKSAQLSVKEKQDRIKRDVKNLRKERRVLRRMNDKYNRKISKMNRLINSHNRLINDITRLNRSIKKVKGKTFGVKEIRLKTYVEDGKKINERTVKNSMTKIEIYGFEGMNKLKAVLAHEIAHLVGIPHIKVKNALMNPILQKNQIEELSLTKEDIRNFKRNF